MRVKRLYLSFKYLIQDPAILIDPMSGVLSLEEVKSLLSDNTTDSITLHYDVTNIDI